ncbi:sulfate adenylyltransferase subunit CysN [Pseudoalteromonas luteoviolacea]|uniref:Sulfate adenylyltransferase subunit 1 n=1 Tax=Pseudoalteromonas luteoviolacea S4054 TaxID=1129367 RepID=A0A0F6AGA4_9GAMM|nr:sulfate adenylyltransferase subunit CysN [Pseudoalteromonas luteoviolacea]AOT09893.1 sulfate adenylyltransferase subunit CysN [Pseudoalteromonas luteoviolacea]AOT14804.1 sulfate adenylyltransferase subunit CysN [Pseudoalteromonas luteoviolacea]AOT19720.1 sulfate adenylyltransferase subunit CysN [Pseudoalteromonas luteoviolacea]KKE85257.1 sulfate adenylyltransferase subunit 1 [Pseudoalteromonas luteoviolacea S4054]KZN64027.1 sulfate adenylyltransferase subunit 1 [Pseudoalteromonas luteoviola
MSTANEVRELGIEAYLSRQQDKSLLRMMTCGSVDDGKSTLIGRLLHDSHQIYEDQLAALHKDNEKVGNAGEELDLALLVDGLQAEREQGITIDVAYRYFSTAKRKFIIADTPGHEQYTRNMVTGASTSDLAIILVDARYGVQVQTKRHSFICDSLGIKQFVVAINKMDIVDFDEAVFEKIKADYLKFAEQLNVSDIKFIPMSALKGDNVVTRSEKTPYYTDKPLLELLEDSPAAEANHAFEARFPVQYVVRPNLDFRGFQGTLTSGSLSAGQSVKVLPSGKSSTIKELVTFDGHLEQAQTGQAFTITLADEIDVSRGDVIVPADSTAAVTNLIQAKLVWMHEEPLVLGKNYNFKLGSKNTSAIVRKIDHTIDVNTLEQGQAEQLQLNEIAIVTLELTESIVADIYRSNHETGSFILIDRISNLTIGAGMIEALLAEESATTSEFSAFELEFNALVRKHFPHWQALDISKLK